MMPSYFNTLFQLIVEVLDAAGGDGDVYVECSLFTKEQIGAAFGRYLEENKIVRLKQIDNPERAVVVFSDLCNENVVFSDEKTPIECPRWADLQMKI